MNWLQRHRHSSSQQMGGSGRLPAWGRGGTSTGSGGGEGEIRGFSAPPPPPPPPSRAWFVSLALTTASAPAPCRHGNPLLPPTLEWSSRGGRWQGWYIGIAGGSQRRKRQISTREEEGKKQGKNRRIYLYMHL